MRKLLLLMAAVVAMVPSPASADEVYTEVVDGIEWTYVHDGDAAFIFNPSYSAAIPITTTGAITVPSILGGRRVTRIGRYAFVACVGLTSVVIPDSVTSIEEGAFVACSGIRSVTIPQSVCSLLLKDVFPSAYQAITNVVISDGVTSIRDEAFQNCTSLASATIPNSVTRIGESAFNGCNDALFNTTTSGVRLVDGWVVGYTEGLAGDLNLADIRGIGDCAFAECGVLTRVTISDGVLHIGEGAFNYCMNLTSVILPNSVTNIQDYAFSDCSGLTSVTIPSSVTSIGECAFGYCSSLTNVIFTGNAPSVAPYAFESVGEACTASVARSSTGWNVAEGEKWHGLTLVYVDGGGGEGDPVVEIVDVAIEEDVQNGVSVKRLVVGVVAKDSGQIVQGDPAKVAFEATSDLRDWDGAAKLTPTVVVLEGDGAIMRFRVTPGDGTATCAFLRIRQ